MEDVLFSLHKYNRKYSTPLLYDIYSVFFSSMGFLIRTYKGNMNLLLTYVVTKLNLVIDSACDKGVFG